MRQAVLVLTSMIVSFIIRLAMIGVGLFFWNMFVFEISTPQLTFPIRFWPILLFSLSLFFIFPPSRIE